MSHPGIAPLNPSTPVGQLRALVGDTQYAPLVPDVPSQGDYAVYADVDLEAALAVANGSILRAAGNLTLTLATQYSAQGRSIKTDDLTVDVRSRGADLLAVAKSFFDQADSSDTAGADDFFDIATPFTGSDFPEAGGFWPFDTPSKPKPGPTYTPPATGGLDGGTP